LPTPRPTCARFRCNLAAVKIEACETADHPGWLRLREGRSRL
jgi:hypothetical protein